jgi:putative transposase
VINIKKVRTQTDVDMHSPLCLAADLRFCGRGEGVVQTLGRVCGDVGYSKTI